MKDPFFALQFQPSRPAYFYTVTATVKNEAGNDFLCFKFFGTLQNANAQEKILRCAQDDGACQDDGAGLDDGAVQDDGLRLKMAVLFLRQAGAQVIQ